MRSIVQKCPHCGTAIGRVVERDNRIFFDTGDSMIESGYKHCHACGYKFMFKPPKVSFDKLLSMAENDRGGLVIT